MSAWGRAYISTDWQVAPQPVLVRTYVRMVREEDERGWLREFILEQWGRGLSSKEVKR